MRRKDGLDHGFNGSTYAFDDEPTLTSAKVTGTNTVTLEFSEELVGGSTDAFVVQPTV